jgi:hypothetical protein
LNTSKKQNLKITKLLFFLFLLVGYSSFGQQIKKFGFTDKFGSKIEAQLVLPYPDPIDSAFIVNNINSKLILPEIDTALQVYRFTIYKFIPKANNLFEVEIHIFSVLKEKERVDKPGTIILSRQKGKEIGYSADNIYKMSLNKEGNKYSIKEFKFLVSKI